MELKNYETVFILTPVLSEDQMKDTVEKFVGTLKNNGAEIVNHENWGLKKLAYPIQHKTTGFYTLVEFKAPSEAIDALETEYRRDEQVLRFLTIALDKHALAFSEKRRAGKFNKKEEKSNEEG
ncbi:30S ribosomal protein S6 [Fulvitalea axinellae]|uniref:Small ribosomal subunit protein bS6 n=1 Tax=Fulvitalea axinellae TaxID=1182444 RepID=A0AAU9CBZ9_9BACT|nr:30S ribosomal protein S6 [Fulvitalea axinellae]